MPRWFVHEFSDRQLFGKSYGRVHRRMDEPARYFGRGHRRYFHDRLSAYIIARQEYPNDDNAVLAAWYHIELDELCSRDPEYRKFLELMATLDKEERKKRKKVSKREIREAAITYAPFLSFLSKLVEFKRLYFAFHQPSPVDFLNVLRRKSRDTILRIPIKQQKKTKRKKKKSKAKRTKKGKKQDLTLSFRIEVCDEFGNIL